MAVASGGGGAIRFTRSADLRETSTGYYSYMNSRADIAGDMWVDGANCFAKAGYSIGTPVLNACLNISSDGNVTIPYIVKTSEIMVDTIRGMVADQVTLDDSVVITSNHVLNGSFNY